MRKLLVLVVVLMLVFAGLFVAAGYGAGPTVQIAKPERFVGATTPVEVAIESPGGVLSSLEVAFEQNGTRTPLVTAVGDATRVADAADRVAVTRTIDKKTVPALAAGPARIVVTASRPAFFGLRQLRSEAARDVQVRLERPKVAAVSTHHYINLGGSEMVVYRVSPDDVQSGVKVGDLEYPGYPAAGIRVAGVEINDPAARVAFFALRYDQPLNTPIHLFARDEAGNSARA